MTVWPRVARRFGPHKARLLVSLVTVLAMTALNVLNPLLLKRVIDQALPRHEVRLLVVLCLGMLVAAILSSVLTVVMAALNNTVGQRIVHQLRVDLYRAMQRMPLAHFTEQATAEIQTRIASDIGGISDTMTFAAQSLIGSAANLVTVAIVMLFISWPLALVSLAISLGLNMLNNRYARRRRSLATQQQGFTSRMLALVGEDLSLSGVILGRTLAREDWQRERFEQVSRSVRDRTIRQRMAGRTAFAIIGATFSCLPIVAYLAAGTALPGLSLGAVVVIAALQMRLSAPIQTLLGVSSDLQSSAVMFERIFAYLDLPENRVRGRIGSGPRQAAIADIALDEVSYAYPGASRAILDRVTVTVPAGARLFVVGASGAGKSTLALLLAGLLLPDTGEIVLRLANGERTGLTDHATLVPQEAVLANETIRENLRFGRPGATDAEIANVLDLVRLTELVSTLPAGLDTQVGERGAQLSGGERQRLALARSILAGYPVIVVDEATSGVDEQTAQQIYDALDAGLPGTTLIVITHRLPRMSPGTLVMALAEGRVSWLREWGEIRDAELADELEVPDHQHR
jgi:ATP-binding cassette subfamily B protein